ncbi:MAG TPA: hypothetical protein VGR78_06815 [Verrucomicrobiae bacterium]|jgi:hypothetical protein|nr:hypothetical protein [Verrucomicrobiae bacterium]
MTAPRTRREFLADVGRGMLVGTLGYGMASELGLSSALGADEPRELTFGSLEPLVRLMQETPANRLLPKLVEQLRSGTELRRLVQAGALANARTFGGEDYVGFHTMMALAPALHMALELPPEKQALPVFKVLYRNTNRIQEHGGRESEILHEVSPSNLDEGGATQRGELLRAQIRQKNVAAAEQTFAALAQRSTDEAFNDLLVAVQDNTEVHRVVLPYRAWDLMGLLGKEQAHTFLRQSVRYCVKAESWPRSYVSDEPRTLLPKLLDEYKLLGRSPGDRQPDDALVDQLSQTIFKSTPQQAADAAAAALADGVAPDAIGEAITLAANQLVLRDYGRTPRAEVAGKPIGSVHGDSIGVHASDSANAWRNIARVSNTRNCFASLILGAYQAALDRTARGGDFLNWEALPWQGHVTQVQATSAESLLSEADEAIRGNMQARATAIVRRYADLGHPARPVFDLLLRYAVSEDGALHAEKFYRTASEEFASTRSTFRWRHVLALARVTASEFGRPAPGMAEARELLKV